MAIIDLLSFHDGFGPLRYVFALLSPLWDINIISSCFKLSFLWRGISVRSEQDKFLSRSSAIVPGNDRFIGVSQWL
jgi:hypothetical protein